MFTSVVYENIRAGHYFFKIRKSDIISSFFCRVWHTVMLEYSSVPQQKEGNTQCGMVTWVVLLYRCI